MQQLIEDKVSKRAEVVNNENSGLAFDYLDILIKYGRVALAFSFSIVRKSDETGRYKYLVLRNGHGKIWQSILFAVVCLFTFLQNVPKFQVTNYSVINWIKRTNHILFFILLVVIRKCLECPSKDALLTKIFQHADNIQEKFRNLEIRLHSRRKVKVWAYLVVFLCAVSSLVHAFIYVIVHNKSGWSNFHARMFIRLVTLDLMEFKVQDYSSPIIYLCGALGIIFQTLALSLWYFSDCLRIFMILLMWNLFDAFNNALADGNLSIKNLPQITNLHLQLTKLLTMMNRWLSPITFFATLHCISYFFFWTNYLVQDFRLKRMHTVCTLFVFRNIFILAMSASVNSKAHRLSSWLEQACSENENLPVMDQSKFVVLTTQLYNRDAIGFKGLNFFTISPTFVSGVIGLIFTYTVVVTQFIMFGPSNSSRELGHPHAC